MERREENRCTTRLRLVGVCDRQRRGNKLVGAARASAILSTLASFLHVPCDGKARRQFVKKKTKEAGRRLLTVTATALIGRLGSVRGVAALRAVQVRCAPLLACCRGSLGLFGSAFF
jgi:hypothetical protein